MSHVQYFFGSIRTSVCRCGRRSRLGFSTIQVIDLSFGADLEVTLRYSVAIEPIFGHPIFNSQWCRVVIRTHANAFDSKSLNSTSQNPATSNRTPVVMGGRGSDTFSKQPKASNEQLRMAKMIQTTKEMPNDDGNAEERRSGKLVKKVLSSTFATVTVEFLQIMEATRCSQMEAE
uniref:SUN domain-containing protein n=1 Tax=Steinernema glaseri TaxID=37863 RepID=A0A1I8A5Q0_9BILA